MVQRNELRGKLHVGKWFSYEDENGIGHCQPDQFIELPDMIVLFECKLSQTWRAEDQMKELYLPVLKHHYDRPVVMIQVFKIMKKLPSQKWIIEHPAELVDFPRPGVFTWHVI